MYQRLVIVFHCQCTGAGNDQAIDLEIVVFLGQPTQVRPDFRQSFEFQEKRNFFTLVLLGDYAGLIHVRDRVEMKCIVSHKWYARKELNLQP